MRWFRRRPKACQRCSEIMASEPEKLVFFWDFSKYTHEQFTDGTIEREQAEAGERVRTLALAMHAQAGHPTEAELAAGR